MIKEVCRPPNRSSKMQSPRRLGWGVAFEVNLKDELTRQRRGGESRYEEYSGNCSGTQGLRAWVSPTNDYLCDLGQCVLTSLSLVSSSIKWTKYSGFVVGSL